jgi:DNA-binding SARP family transcriptional activator
MKIKLLGVPAIVDGSGQEQTVRGHQVWALLARLLMSKSPLSRRTLAAELFPDTVDPLGSLRWCLAALRKALGSAEFLRGDPIALMPIEGTEVDVYRMGSDEFDVETAGPLLEGVDPQCSPEYSTWLLVERERVASVIDGRVRQAAQQAIAVGNIERAIRLAESGVHRAPFDEGLHILLVKGLTLAGRFEAACQHVDATHTMFETELGQAPSAALRSAARRTLSSPPSGVSPRAVIESLLESGLSALSAGAVDAGVDCLRRAATNAEHGADIQLQASTLMALGTALVHSVRGHDDEGAILLRQAIERAQRCGDAGLAATGYRELGYVEALAGRRPTAAEHLTLALDLATDDDERAGVHGVMGFNLVDWGRVDEGLAHYNQSLEHARRANNRRRQAWSLGLGGWGLLAADRTDEAGQWLTDCIQLVDELRWTAFRPWPCALFGETRLRQAVDPVVILADLENAFALSCQLGDPCWEAAVARTLGLSCEVLGDLDRGMSWFVEARRRCVRETDTYVALLVEILVDQARVSAKQGQPAQSDACTREALSLAARAHMDGHVSRAVELLQSSAPV